MKAIANANDLILYLEHLREKRGWALRTLYEAAGVGINFSRMRANAPQGTVGMHVTTLFRILDAFGYEMVIRKRERPKTLPRSSVPTRVVTASAAGEDLQE